MAKDNEKPEPVSVKQPVEALAAALATPDWLFAAAKVKHGWPTGQELTEAQYLKAIEAAGKERIG